MTLVPYVHSLAVRSRAGSRTAAGVFAVLIALAGGGVTLAQQPAAQAPVEVNADGSMNVQAENLPLGELLRAVATQARWDLAVAAPHSALDVPVTLHVKNRTPREVIKVLREVSGMALELDDGLLRVKASKQSSRSERRRRDHDKNDRVVMGQPLTIGPNDTVDDAVALGGPLVIQGHVRGNAVAIGSSVTLAPTATVEGDAVAVGGPLSIEPGATLNGSQVNVLGSVGGFGQWMMNRGQDKSPSSFLGGWGWRILSNLFRSLCLLIFGMLLLAFVPDRVAVIGHSVGERPFLSLLVGISLLMGLVPACVLLAITIIGIPLVPIAIALFLALLLLGATSTALRVGRGIAAGAERRPLTNFCLGVLVFAVVGLVPWFGTLLVFLLTLAGAGAALLSRLGSVPSVPSAPTQAAAIESAV